MLLLSYSLCFLCMEHLRFGEGNWGGAIVGANFSNWEGISLPSHPLEPPMSVRHKHLPRYIKY